MNYIKLVVSLFLLGLWGFVLPFGCSGSGGGSGGPPLPQPCNGEPGAAHGNGGGFVASTATVDAQVYLGPNVEVCENASVSGKVSIFDSARIYGNAVITGDGTQENSIVITENAEIFGNAKVGVNPSPHYHPAVIFGNADIYGYSTILGSYVGGDSQIFGTQEQPSEIRDSSRIEGTYTIENTRVVGSSYITGSGRVRCTTLYVGGHDIDVDRCISRGELVANWTSVNAGAPVGLTIEGNTVGGLLSSAVNVGDILNATLVDGAQQSVADLEVVVLGNRQLATFIPQSVQNGSYSINISFFQGYTHNVGITVTRSANRGQNGNVPLTRLADIYGHLSGILNSLGGLQGANTNNLNASMSTLDTVANAASNLPQADQQALVNLLDAAVQMTGEGQSAILNSCSPTAGTIENRFACSTNEIRKMLEGNIVDQSIARLGSSLGGIQNVESIVGSASPVWTLYGQYLDVARTIYNYQRFWQREQVIQVVARLPRVKRPESDILGFDPIGPFSNVNLKFYHRVNQTLFIKSGYDNVFASHSALATIEPATGKYCEWTLGSPIVPIRVKEVACALKLYRQQGMGLFLGINSIFNIDAENQQYFPPQSNPLADALYYDAFDNSTEFDVVDQYDSTNPGGTGVNVTFDIATQNGGMPAGVQGDFVIRYQFFSDYPASYGTTIAGAIVRRLAITGPAVVQTTVPTPRVTGFCIHRPGLSNQVTIDGSGVQTAVQFNCPPNEIIDQIVTLSAANGDKIFNVNQSVQQSLGGPVALSDSITAKLTRCSGAGGNSARHANGSGWVANTASVDASAYVGPNAEVCDFATVVGSARIEDDSYVYDSADVGNSAKIRGGAGVINFATVGGSAIVESGALVANSAIVSGNARVRQSSQILGFAEIDDRANVTNGSVVADFAIVFDDAIIDDALVDEDAIIYESAQVSRDAWVTGAATVHGAAHIYDDAIVDGLADVFGDAEVYDFARVSDRAVVHGFADVYDGALVYEDAEVTSDVSADAEVFGFAQVLDSAHVRDFALVYDFAEVSGSAVVSDDAHALDSSIITEDALLTSGAHATGSSTVAGDGEVEEDSDLFDNAFVEDGWVRSSEVSFDAVVAGSSAQVANGSIATEDAFIEGDVVNASDAFGSVYVTDLGTLDESSYCFGTVDTYIFQELQSGCGGALQSRISGGGEGFTGEQLRRSQSAAAYAKIWDEKTYTELTRLHPRKVTRRMSERMSEKLREVENRKRPSKKLRPSLAARRDREVWVEQLNSEKGRNRRSTESIPSRRLTRGQESFKIFPRLTKFEKYRLSTSGKMGRMIDSRNGTVRPRLLDTRALPPKAADRFEKVRERLSRNLRYRSRN